MNFDKTKVCYQMHAIDGEYRNSHICTGFVLGPGRFVESESVWIVKLKFHDLFISMSYVLILYHR